MIFLNKSMLPNGVRGASYPPQNMNGTTQRLNIIPYEMVTSMSELEIQENINGHYFQANVPGIGIAFVSFAYHYELLQMQHLSEFYYYLRQIQQQSSQQGPQHHVQQQQGGRAHSFFQQHFNQNNQHQPPLPLPPHPLGRSILPSFSESPSSSNQNSNCSSSSSAAASSNNLRPAHAHSKTPLLSSASKPTTSFRTTPLSQLHELRLQGSCESQSSFSTISSTPDNYNSAGGTPSTSGASPPQENILAQSELISNIRKEEVEEEQAEDFKSEEMAMLQEACLIAINSKLDDFDFGVVKKVTTKAGQSRQFAVIPTRKKVRKERLRTLINHSVCEMSAYSDDKLTQMISNSLKTPPIVVSTAIEKLGKETCVKLFIKTLRLLKREGKPIKGKRKRKKIPPWDHFMSIASNAGIPKDGLKIVRSVEREFKKKRTRKVIPSEETRRIPLKLRVKSKDCIPIDIEDAEIEGGELVGPKKLSFDLIAFLTK